MNTLDDKTQQKQDQSVASAASKSTTGSESCFQFVDNRPETASQRRLQEIANNSHRAKQLMALRDKIDNRNTSELVISGRDVIQAKPIDKDFVKSELRKDEEGKKALEILNTLKVYEYQSLEFMGQPDDTPATTLPHASPPIIYVNEKMIDSDETAVLTLFHEAQHAYDPDTYALNDDSDKALEQDLVNEASVLRKEAEYAIRMGGEYLTIAIQCGSVIELDGKYVPNMRGFVSLLKEGGEYSNYYRETKRSLRFNPDNYSAKGIRDLSGGWIDSV